MLCMCAKQLAVHVAFCNTILNCTHVTRSLGLPHAIIQNFVKIKISLLPRLSFLVSLTLINENTPDPRLICEVCIDLHYRITSLLPWPSGGQLLLVLCTKCMGNDYRGVYNSLLLVYSVSSSHCFEIIYCRYHKHCIANTLKLFVGSKNTANSTAMIVEQRLD